MVTPEQSVAPTCTHDEWEGWDDDCAGNHVADYQGALRNELYHLWNDLVDAQRSAINTDWSIRCQNIAWRIAQISRLVGALPWQHVGISTLENGVYERVHRENGLSYEPVDWDRVAAVRSRIDGRTGR